MLQRWELDPALLPPPPASRQPPTLRPHLQASAPSWSWQHPQQPWLASEAGDGAHAGLHVGRTREEPHVFIHQSQATCAGRVGQAAAGSWLASGARPGRPPLLRGGGGRALRDHRRRKCQPASAGTAFLPSAHGSLPRILTPPAPQVTVSEGKLEWQRQPSSLSSFLSLTLHVVSNSC